jgi:hypothetical protein
MAYSSKRAYDANKVGCYVYTNTESVFTKDDESENLQTYISQNDNNMSDIFSEFNDTLGDGIVNGLQVLAQTDPNRTVQVINGELRKDGIRISVNGSPSVSVNASSSDKPRKDIIYLNKDDLSIGYLAGDYPIIVAGSETYTITTNAEAERAGSNTYTISTNFVGTVAGSNIYTLTTNFVANDTITFDNITLTAVSSNAISGQFNIGTDTSISMTNLATALNANTTINNIYNAVASSNIITITEKVAGSGNTPNNMTIVGTGIIVNGTAINSKTSDTATFNNVTFNATSSTQDSNNFIVGSDVINTATNLTTALNANSNINSLYIASSSSNVITITEKSAGQGNTPSNITTNGTGKITNGTPIVSKTNDTVTINGIVFTAVTSNANSNQFNVGANPNTTATNLTSALNNNIGINTYFEATSNNNIITLIESNAGNGETPTISTTTGTISITNGTIIKSKTNLPVAPVTPINSLVLAEIYVDKNATIITNSNIKDKRKMIITLDNLDSNKQDKINMINSNKISINHNGNCYPFARLLYTDNSTDETYELKREIEYDDKNNISIYIEDEYIGTNGTLSKINDNEYIVAYNEGIITVILNYLT